MSKSQACSELHERSFLLTELGSLGVYANSLNEINDNDELRGLVQLIKESLLEEHQRWNRTHSSDKTSLTIA